MGESSGRLVTEIFWPAVFARLGVDLVGVSMTDLSTSASDSELELELESELELDELDDELLTEDASDWISSFRRALTRVSVESKPW